MVEQDPEARRETRCLLVPMSGSGLLVPNSLVIEILNYRDPHQDKLPEQGWLLGTVRWRNLDVPVVSFERMIGEEYDSKGERRRIIICHTFLDDGDFRFVGIIAQGLPRLVSVDEHSLSVLDPVDDQERKPVFSHVSISGNDAFVPAMRMVGEYLNRISH